MLDQLDRAPADDPRFDPHGPVADRVLRAATADPAPARRRPLRLPVLAGAAAAVAVAGVSIPGSGGDPLRGAAAFAAAAERTARFDSGIARIETVVRTPDGPVHINVLHEIRFSPDGSETSQRAAPGSPDEGGAFDGVTWRSVGGRVWERRPGADWRPLPDAAPHDPLAEEARSIVGDRALADLVRHAEDVTQDGRSFRATIDGEAIRDLPTAPFGIAAIRDLERVGVTMTVAGDGTIARLAVAYGDVTRTITYEALGEPQEIRAP